MQGRFGADYFFNELYRPIHASRVSPKGLNILIRQARNPDNPLAQKRGARPANSLIEQPSCRRRSPRTHPTCSDLPGGPLLYQGVARINCVVS
jgi:hypothetical protein